MKYPLALLILFGLLLIGSGIHPHDFFTWFLEVFPAIIGAIVLLATYRQFKFTNLTYTFIFLHALILMVGGHYTYAEVPLFDWIKESFHQTRNNYDKVGHFVQGFVPALIARELLIRKQVVLKPHWLNVLVVSLCLSISALYEFLEWAVAEMTGESAEAFLGTQGYAWDTQSDMLYAFCGAITSLLLLSKFQNQAIQHLNTVA